MAIVSDLFVKIKADTTSLQRGLATASTAVTAFGRTSSIAASAANKASQAIGVGFVVAGALVAKGLSSAVDATVKWAEQVRTLQLTTGLAAEQASALLFASNSLGIASDKLGIAFGLLEKNIVNNTANFAKYNIATQDASGGQLDLIQILGNVSDKYNQLGGGIHGAALAQNVFGRSGRNLIPILAEGSAGLQDLFDKANAFGLVIGQGTVDAVHQMQVAERQLSLAWQGFEVQVGTHLIPIVNTLLTVFTDVVRVLDAVPGPVIDLAGGFVILTGALFALSKVASFIKGVWAPIIGVFGTLTGASAASTGAMTAELGSAEALTAAIADLVPALQALAGIQTEVAATASAAAAAIGFEARASGLLVPEALAGAPVGVGAGAAGTGAGFSALAGGATAAALAIGSVVAGFVLFRIAADGADRAFQAGIAKDLKILQSGSKTAAANLRAFAAQPPAVPFQRQVGGVTVPQLGAANVLALQGRQVDQANQAIARYDAMLAAAQSSTGRLAQSLFHLTADVVDFAQVLPTAAVDDLNASIGNLSGGFDRFSKVSGIDATSTLATFSAAVNKSGASWQDAAAAATDAIATMRAAYAQWHDSLVQAFGGAGSALDAFANQSNVDIGRATNKLTQYTRQIESFGANIKTISGEFGKRASAFIQWATSQGLAQQGLVASVASANKKNAAAFVSAFNTGQTATSDLASQIQKVLDPAFARIIFQLRNISRALQHKHVLKWGDGGFNAGLDHIQQKLRDLKIGNHDVKVGVTDNTGHPILTIGEKLAHLTGSPFFVTLKADTSAASSSFASFVSRWAGTTVTFFGLMKPITTPHAGGPILHSGGMVPAVADTVSRVVPRMHSGGLKSDEVPAVLQRGEFVIRRQSVEKIGVPVLNAMNRLHSGGSTEQITNILNQGAQFHLGGPISHVAHILHEGGSVSSRGSVVVDTEVSPTVRGLRQLGDGKSIVKAIENLRLHVSLDRRKFSRQLDWENLTSGR